jgi:multimeric flavodoxin WrbA
MAFSPRHGNTEILVKEALDSAKKLEVETEFYSMAGKTINYCNACYKCFSSVNPKKPCPEFCDAFDEIVPLIKDADGLIIGSPVYYMGVTSQLKAFMDRSISIEAIGYAWRNKVLGCIAVGYDRCGGQETVIKSIQNWAMMHDMILVGVGPERPVKGIGGYTGVMAVQGFPHPVLSGSPEALGAVKTDDIGMYAAHCLGLRVAEVSKALKAGFQLMKDKIYWPVGATKVEFAVSMKKLMSEK